MIVSLLSGILPCMPQELMHIPLFWQEAVPEQVQQMVTTRRHRYVAGASLLEADGFVPVTQVTLRSGRLLKRGDPHLTYMVEGSIRRVEEQRVRDASGGKELEFRCARGTVVPLVELQEITGPRDIVASRTGFTLYVREVQKQQQLQEAAQMPVAINYANLVLIGGRRMNRYPSH